MHKIHHVPEEVADEIRNQRSHTGAKVRVRCGRWVFIVKKRWTDSVEDVTCIMCVAGEGIERT